MLGPLEIRKEALATLFTAAHNGIEDKYRGLFGVQKITVSLEVSDAGRNVATVNYSWRNGQDHDEVEMTEIPRTNEIIIKPVGS